MKPLLWILTGVLMIGIPFALLLDPYDLWPALMGGTVSGSIFLSLFLIRHRSVIRFAVERTMVIVTALLLMGGMLLQINLQKEISVFQRNNLRETRAYIGSEIIVEDKIRESMQPVFAEFHAQTGGQRRSLKEIFLRCYGAAMNDGSFNRYSNTSEYTPTVDAVTVVTFTGDTAVHYRCVDTVAIGITPGFKNVSGHSGKLEYAASLTRKGVTYERLN
jgi:hypothetical protein